MNPETREALERREPPERVERMWRAIDGARRRASRGRLLLAGFAVAAAGLGLWVAVGGTLRPSVAPETATLPAALRLEDGTSPGRSLGAMRTTTFADGSSVVTGEGTDLELLENGGAQIGFALREGTAHFEVEPGGPRRWRVVAHGVEVVVVGTGFDVSRDGEAVDVAVSHGAVLVRGPGVRDGEQRLEAGQRLRVAPPTRRSAGPAARPPEPERPPVAVPAASRPAPDVDSLMRRADRARAAGDARAAAHLLERAWREHPEDPRASLAAFTQGRLELDRLRDPAGAAVSLGESLRLGLQAPLRETARALRIRAWGEAGDSRAAEAASRFLADHPGSDYGDAVRRWLPAEPAP